MDKTMQKQFSQIPDAEPVIILTRIFDAPRDLVWAAFTKPEHLVHWWGPEGFSVGQSTADIRDGGHWTFAMTGPDGTRFDNHHQFIEFDPMNALSYRLGTSKNDPGTTISRITFIDHGHGTEVTITMTFASMADCAEVMGFGAHELGLQTLAKAETYIHSHLI